MGLDWYAVNDLFGTSKMEEKRNEYEAVANYVRENIEEVKKQIEEIKESLNTELDSLRGESDTSYGTIRDKYDEKFDFYEKQMKGLLWYFEDNIESFEKQLSEVDKQYEYYKEKADEEDKARKEINE